MESVRSERRNFHFSVKGSFFFIMSSRNGMADLKLCFSENEGRDEMAECLEMIGIRAQKQGGERLVVNPVPDEIKMWLCDSIHCSGKIRFGGKDVTLIIRGDGTCDLISRNYKGDETADHIQIMLRQTRPARIFRLV